MSQCALVGREGACDLMQCRALDATVEGRCHLLTRWLSRLWPGLWRAIAGHQCSLLESGRADRLIGQTAPKTCHISCSVLFCFGVLRHHPACSRCSNAAARVSQLARRLTMQGDGCGKGGTDLTAHACLLCSLCYCSSISASKFGRRCDPPACSQHARRRQQFEILRDPLSGASCSQCRAPCRNTRSSFHSRGPSQ